MNQKEKDTSDRLSELQAKAKDCFLKFEELRGFL